jgi:exodeoxyribonuclease-3
MKIISWNVNGLRAVMNKGLLKPVLEKENPDILCLQETKASPEQLAEEIKNMLGYFSYFSECKTKKGYSGVAIYTKEKPTKVFYGMGIEKFDQEGRIVGAQYKNFTLINVYFPNGGMGPERLKYKLEFYEGFLKFILKLRKKEERVIFCGDVNTAHQAIDLARPKENEKNTGFLPIERAWIDQVVSQGFVDVFREFYPSQKDIYTYWDMKTFARDRNVGWRIDYFFADSLLFNYASLTCKSDLHSLKIKKTGKSDLSVLGKSDLPSFDFHPLKIKNTGIMNNYYGSDHCPIWVELK